MQNYLVAGQLCNRRSTSLKMSNTASELLKEERQLWT